ncbi:hypothetical protein M408DRAFT_73840 [Serendipita vermifera MAFF 305830]|uniref:Peptide hydrolase n=1 Tax=Serendipita vermifera MAFF 305830 TaxID=933852 RepID=A0A0C3B2S6_SERVB|nr:hypothetical protein M408DRAFT_73840 [Serendipita vermifera MAFF 305830]
MLSLSLVTLVTFATSPFFTFPQIYACNSHDSEPPALWLAGLRNSTGMTAPLMSGAGVRKIRFGPGTSPVLITEAEKDELEKTRIRYFDVTEHDLEATRAERLDAGFASLASFPSGPTHQDAVKAVISTLSVENLKTDLAVLSAYNNRYYKSTTGVQASNELVTKLKSIAAAAPGTGGAISVNSFAHTFSMPSVIGRIEGTNSSAPVVIIGAHLDSINQNSPSTGRAPGSDDDGTGSVNLIEAFRKMTASGFKPANPVEYHWYAGEEAGLLGSAAIANAYAKKGTSVKGMLQLDMTGYVKPGTSPVVGFITDHVDPALTTFTKTLVNTYLTGIGIAESQCGYACSDHASWTSAGYSSVMPFESTFGNDNPNIHGTGDVVTVNGFDFNHAHEFTKLAVAFLMELSLPTTSTPGTTTSRASTTSTTRASTASTTTTRTTTTSPKTSSTARTTSTSSCPW